MRLVERVQQAIGSKPRRVWRAYQDVFSGESAKVVLADLADNAGLMDAATSNDPIELALAAGRRQNFLYILDRLNMSYSDITQIQKHIDHELGGESNE